MDTGTTTIEGGDPVPKRRRIVRKIKGNEDKEGTECSSSRELDAGNNQQKGKKSIMKLTLTQVKL